MNDVDEVAEFEFSACLSVYISVLTSHVCVCVFRPEECARPFPLHPCLVSPDSELAFLRCVARILLLCLLPKKDAKSHTLRCCLTEVITTKGTACVVPMASPCCARNWVSLFDLALFRCCHGHGGK